MTAETPEAQPESQACLQRIESLLKLLVKLQLKPILETELADEQSRKVYEMTGENTAPEIANATALGLGTVSGKWTRWEQPGLVVKDGSRYRKSTE